MAINFPSTSGQATDGTFTYLTAGITYSWDGGSWSAAGGGATATDRTVFSVTNASAGITSLNYDNVTGVFTYTPQDLSSYLTTTGSINSHSDVTITGTPSDGSVLSWNSANIRWENTVAGSGGGLDSDLLDGQEGSYYLNSNNQDAGTLPTDRLSGSYNISISGSADSIGSLNSIGDVTITTPVSGQVITYNGSGWVNADSPSRRKTITTTLSNVSNNSISNVSIATPNTYALLKIETSHACWVTLYTDTNSRTSDSLRSINTDPLPGSGVLAEVVNTSANIQLITPGTICFNNGSLNQTYAKIVNQSGSTVNLQVILTLVSIED